MRASVKMPERERENRKRLVALELARTVTKPRVVTCALYSSRALLTKRSRERERDCVTSSCSSVQAGREAKANKGKEEEEEVVNAKCW